MLFYAQLSLSLALSVCLSLCIKYASYAMKVRTCFYSMFSINHSNVTLIKAPYKTLSLYKHQEQCRMEVIGSLIIHQ